MATDDSMSDDVFEEDVASPPTDRVGLNVISDATYKTPSPTGYKDYRPPPELFETPSLTLEQVNHKTILLGDSGVGKTSLLVQFDTGKFQGGSFAATVGIGFTKRRKMSVPSTPNAVRRTFSKKQWTRRCNSEGVAGEDSPAAQPHPQQEPVTRDQGPLIAKVMLLGDSGVGKTCLLVRFRDGHFLSGNFISTVGIDFRNKIVTVDDTKVKLQIWDTAGQERFRSVTHAYYRDAHALLLLYDVTNKTSFDNIRAWLGEIREYAQDDVVIMLLGNKADCGAERVVRKEDGERLAREYNVAFMETSAKSGMNVELAFTAIARELKSRKSKDPEENTFNVKEYIREQSQRTTCPPCST